MEKLTPKQQRVYDYIRDTLAATGAPPTRAEIAEALGFASANAAQAHLRTLARKGAIELGSRRSRGIRLLGGAPIGLDGPVANDDDHTDEGLAVIGRVAAGMPVLAVEHIERRVQVSQAIFSAPADYLLTVQGDSMTGAGILDGDLLGVRRTTDVREGQIAVFRLGDDVTVKRFHRDRDGIRLLAENPDYPDITVDAEADELALEGLAVGVLRAIS
ncbi:transcriptional repressor LexA [Salinisphaera sp. Q1T1-3]|uniref:transcriptional repressor LexA n=1 Tax=Salinisphaera sp. Q1T1-3 TaxID=2321229 RepID=UPI000E70A148|nr:transcriptional repressor LexA [Salinisphaera sp. Q1T1-3]RJS93994.1 transcriptional repressor LexA [Salinisphaera sp. Q1T1-3]